MNLLNELLLLEAQMLASLAKLQEQINAIRAVGENNYQLEVKIVAKP